MADRQKSHMQNAEEHKRLASVLKKVHADLRKKLRQCGGDFDTVWDQHCQDHAVLSTYAQSMKSLAQDHWTKNSTTRIDWCRDTIVEYFHGGGLKKVLEKDRKRQMREKRTDPENLEKVELDTNKSVCQNEMTSGLIRHREKDQQQQQQQSMDIGKHDDEGRAGDQDNGATAVSTLGCVPARGRRLRLLDVGSCYNPFLHYQDFLAVGVDLSPACESVHRCDFLRLHVVTEQRRSQGETGERGDRENSSDGPEVDRHLQSLRSPVETLPGGVFHAVVFSLLLEYLPAPRPRWLCCLQAHRLLGTHGLLLVVTPDSHSQHRNAPMIRSWRTAIEALGFSRWRYVKQEHLHCMAFRKLDQPPPYPPCPAAATAVMWRKSLQDRHHSRRKIPSPPPPLLLLLLPRPVSSRTVVDY